MEPRSIPPELNLKPLEPGFCSNGEWAGSGLELASIDPGTGEELGRVLSATPEETEKCIENAREAFESWRKLPAPQRGEIVRRIGEELRQYKKPLGKLVSLECGKILSEGEGEVQEMIDIADFAVGLLNTGDADVDHHGARTYHITGDGAGPPDRHDQNLCQPGYGSQIRGA